MLKTKKIFIIAGEPSGDLHGSNLIKAIRKIENNCSFMGHGGDLMKSEGVQILEHIDNLSFMGFTEVFYQLPKIINIFEKTKKAIKKTNPDRVILIDYPGFNLRLAKEIFSFSIPITYYILPQVWAWKKNRIKVINQFIDQSISIFPFEKDWYSKNNIRVEYFGHPFTDDAHLGETSKSFYNRHQLTIEYPILLLLPGSRKQEIERHWPIFLKVVDSIKKDYPNIQFLLGKAPAFKIDDIPKYIKVEVDPKKAMIVSTAAIVASGTATLECAIEELPMVVCYKMSKISWLIAKFLTKIKFSSMVNIIADKKIVPELLQKNMTKRNIVKEILPLLEINSKERINMVDKIKLIKNTLGKPGVYDRTAKSILKRTTFYEDRNINKI